MATPAQRRALEAASNLTWNGMEDRYGIEQHLCALAAWRALQPDPDFGDSPDTAQVIFSGKVHDIRRAEAEELLGVYDKAALAREKARQGLITQPGAV